MFEEFPRDDSYSIQFTVTWPDDEKDVVSFKNKCSWRGNEPHISSTVKVNGRKQDSFLLSHTLN